MAQQIGEDTKITIDLKTIGLIIGGAVSLATLYFTLQADIARAMELEQWNYLNQLLIELSMI
jgi:hypothetical protein